MRRHISTSFLALGLIVTTSLTTSAAVLAMSAEQANQMNLETAKQPAAALAEPAVLVIDSDVESQIEEALPALEAHGIDPAPYLSHFRGLQSRSDDGKGEAVTAFLEHLVADLRDGVTHDASAMKAGQAGLRAEAAKLIECDDIARCLQKLAARDAAYEPIQLTLKQYESIAKEGGWARIATGGKIAPGMSDARIPAIRSYLSQVGDYKGKAPETVIAKPITKAPQPGASAAVAAAAPVADANRYDAALEQAVKQFQARHGLEDDGVIGQRTIATMNVPVETRIEQLKFTLERLRMLPDHAQSYHVRVNIPGYRLQAFNGERAVLDMPVIVGQTSRKTPMFTNSITQVALNPTWTPTHRILAQDLLPKFRANPNYAVSGNYVVHDRHTGAQISPHNIDWYSVSASDISVMQRSGSANALGKVKFLLPDNDSVYLHDTSKPELFQSAMRALSSGCIRLSDPKAFLDYIIDAQKDKRFETLEAYYQGKSQHHETLDKPIPVHTTYFTAWVNNKGLVEFYDDIYARDPALRVAMNRDTRVLAMR